ncbi:hypothetical protein BV20DRAFT_973058 [Pilatotrama ljubarskyi]|nr:hypothetical protein BV20DRAFT_973058 [Pilatotrama ljubarskyi]
MPVCLRSGRVLRSTPAALGSTRRLVPAKRNRTELESPSTSTTEKKDGCRRQAAPLPYEPEEARRCFPAATGSQSDAELTIDECPRQTIHSEAPQQASWSDLNFNTDLSLASEREWDSCHSPAVDHSYSFGPLPAANSDGRDEDRVNDPYEDTDEHGESHNILPKPYLRLC